MEENSKILTRKVIEIFLVLIVVLLLLDALYKIFNIFFGVLTFALIFAVSFSSSFKWLCKVLKQRRKLAAIIYSIVVIAIIAIPVMYFFSTLIHRIKELVLWIGDARKNGFPPLPAWLEGLPFAGESIHSFWQQLQTDPQGVFISHENEIKAFLQNLVKKGLGILGISVELIIGIIVSAFFLYREETVTRPIKTLLQHFAGNKTGIELLETSGMAIKSVATGVMGTAFIAAIFAWIGLLIGANPIATGLSAIIFLLVVIQIGPLLVWIPLIIYTISQHDVGLAVFYIIWGVALLLIDTVLKPILIGKSGGRIPFLALFIGVIGGIAAWGFTGMFKGAVIIALVHNLFSAWLIDKKRSSLEKTTIE